jgi:hypothetical protein
MQANLICYRIGNQNPRHVRSHQLGESTPPQEVNGLIIFDPNLLDPLRRTVSLIYVV